MLSTTVKTKDELLNTLNLGEKINDSDFKKDTELLLTPGIEYRPDDGYNLLTEKLTGYDNHFNFQG